jgi:hypothetical protein
MGIFDLFSKRQSRLRGEFPDVYVYDDLPNSLRVQIVHIIRDAFGGDHYGSVHASEAYKFINNALCREYGVFELTKHPRSLDDSVFNFFLTEKSVERALDVIELSFKLIDTYIRDHYPHNSGAKIGPDDAIAELNGRFKEHGIGFQFESSELIRVDSDFIHSEAVKPTLAILRESKYEGANDEFLKAHEHYRHGRYKECLVDALKSFESTLKVICAERGWKTQPTDNAKALINACLSQGLLPSFLESQMGAVRSLLESGLPTVRNKLGGHGQGTETIAVPEYFARYALNLTASSILLMAEADAAKK